MKDSVKKFIAFTMAESVLVMAIIGLIAALVIPQLLTENTSQKGWTTMAQKTQGYLTQATVEMLIYNSALDTLEDLKDDDVKFKITDADAASKMSKLFQKYIAKTTETLDTTNAYFTNEILNYERASTGIQTNTYSNFFVTNDGVILGFKFYGNCTTTENIAIAPKHTIVRPVPNICGSVFIDVNGLNKPNKLGSDQYVAPIGLRGIIYEN